MHRLSARRMLLNGQMSRPIRGFTLIELLVVVGIIGLLMAILLPALGRARAEAMKITCASQLRQWGASLQTYAGDHNNRFPQAGPQFVGGDRLMMHRNYFAEPDHPWFEFINIYLVPKDAYSIRDATNTVEYCPVGPPAHRTWPEWLMGYFYLPNRSTVYNQVEPGLEGWLQKSRFDGPYARAPIMSDTQKLSGDDIFNLATFELVVAHAHLNPQTGDDHPADASLGSNFLYEDGSVQWVNATDISIGAVGSHATTMFFNIDVSGIVADY